MPGRMAFQPRAPFANMKEPPWPYPDRGANGLALKGDREKCLDAGMDSYLSKPIHADQLIELVESIASSSPAKPIRESAIADEATTPEFSIEAALVALGGEEDLLQEHIGFVLSDIPQLIASLKSAINDNDSKLIERNAHKLKSMVSSYDHNAASTYVKPSKVRGV